MNEDNIFWTFSAAAQSISAFIALVLAGYALVNSIMESALQRDDTLEEVHQGLKKKYHRDLKGLAVLIGLAILLSLSVVFVNHWIFSWKNVLVAIVSLVDITAIVWGLWFVVSIVDPAKYKKEAKDELEDTKREFGPGDETSPSLDFFEAFIDLEREIRNYLKDKDLDVPSRGTPRMSFSFRQMIEALAQAKVISADYYQELSDINKYRNLVFHGHVQHVDREMLEKVKQATNRFKELAQTHTFKVQVVGPSGTKNYGRRQTRPSQRQINAGKPKTRVGKNKRFRHIGENEEE